MTSICIVAHNAFGVITGDESKHVGGVEVQTRLLAEWLSSNGFDVIVATWNEGDPEYCQIPGVRLITFCRSDEGLPVLRFFYPRWTSLYAALAEADANIYFQSGAEYCTGQIALWCRRHQKKFVFSVASDMDCEAKLPLLSSLRERVLYRIGLKLADQILTQTRNQRDLLSSELGADSLFLPMPCKISTRSDLSPVTSDESRPRSILMLCRVSKVKNIEMYLEVAGLLPHATFVLVGPLDDEAGYGHIIRSKVDELDNVDWPGSASGDDLLAYYKEASIFCCTSKFEGFPNTFLEAWAFGVPVISTVDPDGIIEEHRLGAHVGDAVSMAETISRILASPSLLLQLNSNCEQYFLKTHEPNNAIQLYADEFQRLCESD